VYVLNSAAVIRQALTSEARKPGKGPNYGRAKALTGNGLVMAEGDTHRLRRRLRQPAFHRTEIARCTQTMRGVAVPRIGAWAGGSTFPCDREMRSITLTVLTRTPLSADIGPRTVDEIERLLRVLLSELVTQQVSANVPGLSWVPTRSNRRFSGAAPRPRRLRSRPAATKYRRSALRATLFPVGQGARNCTGEGFAWTEATLLLSAIAARWQLRLADGADVHPVISSTLVPSELPVTVTRRR
jgi:cytochrome P450